MSKTIYEFKAKLNNGEEVEFKNYEGKALLIVNTASKCGFTPQYAELKELKDELGDKFEVLAFPCNQFGKQEPGDSKEIQSFCDLEFNINFPLFEKVDVNGDEASPIFKFLKEDLPGALGTKAIKWNFTKFLIDSSGNPIKRFAPKTSPKDLKPEIEKLFNSL